MLDIIKSLKHIVCASFFIVAAAPSLAANNVIDVLVVYTKGTADAYSGNPTTRINQLFQVTNQIYLDSGVDLEIRVANTLMVDYTDDNSAETALHDITYNRDQAFKAVATAREQAKADMVIFYRPFKVAHGNCGLAWVGGMGTEGSFANPALKNFMYAHIAFNGCGDFITAHELGHNMGLRHSRKQDGKGGTFDYALGYGVENKFTTIMAYQNTFNVDYWEGKVYKFSNPELTCKGLPCGVDRNDNVNGADASYALNVTTPQIATFFAGKAVASSLSNSSANSSAVSSSRSSISSGGLTNDIVQAKAAYETALAAVNANKKIVAEKVAQVSILQATLAAKVQITIGAQAAYDTAANNYGIQKNQSMNLNSQLNAALIAYYRANTSSRKNALNTYNALVKQYNLAQDASAQALRLLTAAQSTLTLATAELTQATNNYGLAKDATAVVSAQTLPLQIAAARALAVYRDVQAKHQVASLAFR